jgi:hypothetical protein
MKRAALLMTAMMLSLLLAAGVALANTTIDTTPQADSAVRFFGHGQFGTATYGQVITAPANDTQLDSFTFLMNLPDTVVFRGEVYAWDGEKATGPNLYESVARTTSGSGSFEEITFDTGGVRLVPGQQYILFATVSKDYEDGSGSGEWRIALSSDVYAGGEFAFMDNDSDFAQLFTQSWDHSWPHEGELVVGDLAFKAVFSSPTPTKQQCKKGGWSDFGYPNQGTCVSDVNRRSR